jgi:hypothetical protein
MSFYTRFVHVQSATSSIGAGANFHVCGGSRSKKQMGAINSIRLHARSSACSGVTTAFNSLSNHLQNECSERVFSILVNYRFGALTCMGLSIVSILFNSSE